MYDPQNLVKQLCSDSHFKGISKASFTEVIKSGQMLEFAPDEVIFREGESGAGLFVLLNGQVRLMKTGLQGIESIIYILNPVVLFNETTAIDGKSNPVTAIADQESTVWQISPGRFQVLMRRYPDIGFGLLCILTERNRILLARYEDLLSRSVLARTAKLLISLDQDGGRSINRYEHPNQRIAALAATVPEAVSRSLNTLKREGIIECTRAQIKILSREKLSRYAQIEPIILEYPRRQQLFVEA